MDGVWKNSCFQSKEDIERVLTNTKNRDNQYKSKDTSQKPLILWWICLEHLVQLGQLQSKISNWNSC